MTATFILARREAGVHLRRRTGKNVAQAFSPERGIHAASGCDVGTVSEKPDAVCT
jgi:hypothetical protein